ncbi:hypothetical protein SAMN02745202_01273 [Segatella oulorum]|uniref:Uncharacterized protein n=1 Tax=Segatella oulorum TaxID=28136 RepID=A0A1T4P3K6_9BACT|nr:hypothetical protein SAMN02745202_01273 [Segatella oulorum]
MRRFIAIILLILPVTSMSAQSYHAINIDAKTVAAMTAAYAIEEETERKTASDVDSILGHYTKASLSTAGIYLSKLKDRNAMREVGVFGSDENYYYQRILYLVKDGIMPKLIVVAAKMVKQPDNALYWGPYLFKTTKNVEQLCKQFELVVTNGKLSFKDVTFLVINEKLQKVFDLAQLGNVNWKELLEKVGDFNIKAAKEDIKNDIGKLGGVLATAGKGVVDSNMRDFSAIGRIFKSKPSEIYQLYQTFRSKYESIRNAGNVKAILMGVIGSNSADAVSRLFQVDNYSITGYVSNYIKELQGQYYKQRWYIYSDDSGSKVLCDYKPKAEANYDDQWNGWLHFVSPRDNEYCHVLTSSEMASAKTESERLAGWNQAKVDKYNKEHPGHHATITYVLQHENRRESYKHGWGARHYKRHCFYAYSIKIVDSWSIKHEVHEENFDSESMDEETFKKRMESQLKYWNSLESDKPFSQRVTYKLGNDARKYYTIADENKMKGCNSVVFLAKCDDGATLAEGSFNWKENGNQGKHLEDPKSKNFALDKTQVSTNGANELQQKKKGCQDEIKSLENQIRSMDKQMSSLISQMNQAKMAHDNNKVAALRAQYDTVSNNQTALKRQLSQVQSNLAQIDNAIAEYYKDLNEDNGSPYRINSNMRELASLFQLSWQDAGEWVNGDGQYIFVRHAYCAQVKSQVTYTAVLKLQSKPKHFLGIRIHRAILSVDYKLSAAYSAENVIETMNLDMSLSEKERAAKVNERQKQLMEDMPDCSITVRYNYAKNMPNEEGPDAIHLLWASDRLDVARGVEYQLSVIYSQLVLLEKVMNDRQTIKDFLTNQLLNPITRKSRGTIAEYALGRWTDASDKAKKASSSPTSQKAKP